MSLGSEKVQEIFIVWNLNVPALGRPCRRFPLSFSKGCGKARPRSADGKHSRAPHGNCPEFGARKHIRQELAEEGKVTWKVRAAGRGEGRRSVPCPTLRLADPVEGRTRLLFFHTNASTARVQHHGLAPSVDRSLQTVRNRFARGVDREFAPDVAARGRCVQIKS